MTGGVLESGFLLILPQQDPRFDKHILDHVAIRSMADSSAMDREIQLHRYIMSLHGEEKRTFIKNLP